MASSNALAAKAALKALIDGLPELATIQRTWGFPKGDPEKRWAHIGEVTWENSDWATNRSREERFKVRVVVSCIVTASSSEEAETIAWEYASAIENAVTNNPTLGIATVVTSAWAPETLNSWTEGQAYEAQLVAGVRFTARVKKD